MPHGAPTVRCANFTTSEKQIFMKILEDYRSVIECPKLDKFSSLKKKEGWAKVAARFNALPFTTNRTPRQMRVLWRNMRRIKKITGAYTGNGIRVDRHRFPMIVDGVLTIPETSDEEGNQTMPREVYREVSVETTESAEPDTTNAVMLDVTDELASLVTQFEQTQNGSGSGDETASPRLTKVESLMQEPAFPTGGSSANSNRPRSRTTSDSTRPPPTSNKLILEIGQGDPDLLFLISLAPMLRKLNAEKSSRFKIQALQWLHDAEFGC